MELLMVFPNNQCKRPEQNWSKDSEGAVCGIENRRIE